MDVVEDIERGNKLQEDRVRKSPASRILNKDQRIGSEMLMEDVRGTGLGRSKIQVQSIRTLLMSPARYPKVTVWIECRRD